MSRASQAARARKGGVDSRVERGAELVVVGFISPPFLYATRRFAIWRILYPVLSRLFVPRIRPGPSHSSGSRTSLATRTPAIHFTRCKPLTIYDARLICAANEPNLCMSLTTALGLYTLNPPYS